MKIGHTRSKQESELKRAIHDHLDDLGIAWYLCAAGAYSKEGDPDCIACVDGKILCIEAKMPGGNIREAQLECKKETEDSGGMFIFAYSVKDVDDAIAILRG